MKNQIRQFITNLVAKARELDWRAIWQAAIPLMISGVFINALGG